MNVLEANTVAAEVTVTAPSLVPAPTALVKLMLPVPAVRPRVCAPLRVLLKVMAAPAVELPVVSIATEPVVNATVLLNIIASPDVVMFTPAMVAALATVNALLKEDAPPEKVTPVVPPAVRVVMPLMVPPPVTAFTVIVPAPAAVMFNKPAAVIKSSSASVRLNPAPRVPKNTLVPELLVISIAPVTFIAALITTSLALLMVRDES